MATASLQRTTTLHNWGTKMKPNHSLLKTVMSSPRRTFKDIVMSPRSSNLQPKLAASLKESTLLSNRLSSQLKSDVELEALNKP